MHMEPGQQGVTLVQLWKGMVQVGSPPWPPAPAPESGLWPP